MIGTKVAVLALVLGEIGAVGAAVAHVRNGEGGGFGHGRHAMRRKFFDFMVNEKLDEIGATDAQKQKVREIRDRLCADAKALRPAKGTLHRELATLLEQDNPDPVRLKALVKEYTDAITRFGDEAIDAAIELHGVLTPEQRKKLLTDVQEHMESRHRF
jgi:Spy/CpxP family protein refolding chaperone